MSYAYDGAPRQAVAATSLRIARGEFVAFTGLSGSGKTTTVDLILGLLQPSGGKVLINGRPTIGLRHRFGYVPQEPLIFDDTFRRNITLEDAQTAIDQAAFEEAVTWSSLEDVLRSLPHELDFATGESGMRLSGGERQKSGLHGLSISSRMC